MINDFFNFVNDYLIENNIINNIYIINKDKLDDIDYKNIDIYYIDYNINNLLNEKIIDILRQLYEKINDNSYIFINSSSNNTLNEILNNEYCIIYKEENKLVLRKDIKYIIDKLVNYDTKRLQILGEIEFKKIIKIFEENKINYLVYFGNLIGLLRHNDLFIPWDLDIDIIVDTNIDKLLKLFKNYKI